jgi:hypothetical protein
MMFESTIFAHLVIGTSIRRTHESVQRENHVGRVERI